MIPSSIRFYCVKAAKCKADVITQRRFATYAQKQVAPNKVTSWDVHQSCLSGTRSCIVSFQRERNLDVHSFSIGSDTIFVFTFPSSFENCTAALEGEHLMCVS